MGFRELIHRFPKSDVRVVFAFFMLFIAVTIGSLSGCGGTSSGDGNQLNNDPLHETFYMALQDQPATRSVYINPFELENGCQPQRIQHLRETFDLQQSSIQSFYGQCMEIYQCSEHAKNALQTFASTGLGFRLTVTDFAALPGAPPIDTSTGLYLVNTDRVFLQAKKERLYILCGTFLHELFHRFDPDVSHLGESLRAEFPAYHLQFWYEAELKNHQSEVGGAFRTGIFSSLPLEQPLKLFVDAPAGGREVLTRFSLAQWINRRYHLSDSDGALRALGLNYEAFPWESN